MLLYYIYINSIYIIYHEALFLHSVFLLYSIIVYLYTGVTDTVTAHVLKMCSGSDLYGYIDAH